LMDEKWGAHDSFFLSSCIDLDGCKLGSNRIAWLHGFLSRFDLF
jgi:hypothetical protein